MSTVRSKTRPGSIFPSRTSGSSSSMYARTGAGPPPTVPFLQDDRAVTDDGDRVAWLDAGDDRRVVAGAEHVGEREQRRHERVVLVHRQRVQRAVGEWNPQSLCLRGAGGEPVEEPAVDARSVQAL